MTAIRFLLVSLVFVTFKLSALAQDFSAVQYYSTPILLNPSYVGQTGGDRLLASVYTSLRQNAKSYQKFISHDFFVKKKSLGLGFITGIRRNHQKQDYIPFLELSAAKFIPLDRRRYFTPSLTLGIHQPFRDPEQYLADHMTNSNTSPEDGSLRGSSFFRTTELVAGAGLLLSNYHGSVGVASKIRRSYKKNPSTESYNELDWHILFHAEKIFTWYQRGLLSRRYLIRPKAVFHYGNEFTQLFAELTVQRKQLESGIGFLPNFDTSQSRFSLHLGYDFKVLKVCYLGSLLKTSQGFQYPMHNISLRVILPELKRIDVPVPALIRSL